MRAAVLLLTVACGGQAGNGANPGDGGTMDDAALRVPSKHRPAGATCPQERAPVTPEPPGACLVDAGTSPMVICDCTEDSDCTGGPNGRCGQWIPPPVLACNYDECFRDSDCDGGTPCECRASTASSAPNQCLGGGNCTVDSDCGAGGYCSPSVLEIFCFCFTEELCPDGGSECWETTPSGERIPVPCVCGDKCGHGYFCHTDTDTCIDDSDCDGADTCNYDVLSHRWECSAVTCSPGFTPNG